MSAIRISWTTEVVEKHQVTLSLDSPSFTAEQRLEFLAAIEQGAPLDPELHAGVLDTIVEFEGDGTETYMEVMERTITTIESEIDA